MDFIFQKKMNTLRNFFLVIAREKYIPHPNVRSWGSGREASKGLNEVIKVAA